MNTVWYCNDCEQRIERAEIADHEDQGHSVRGTMRPDRLLGNDPWNIELAQDDRPKSETNDEVSD